MATNITFSKNTFLDSENIVLVGTVDSPTAFSVIYSGQEILLDELKSFTLDIGGVLEAGAYDLPLTIKFEDDTTEDIVVQIAVEVTPEETLTPEEIALEAEVQHELLLANDSQLDFVPDYTISKETNTSHVVSELGSEIKYGPIETDAQRWPVRRNIHDVHGAFFVNGNMTAQEEQAGDDVKLTKRDVGANLVSGGFTF